MKFKNKSLEVIEILSKKVIPGGFIETESEIRDERFELVKEENLDLNKTILNKTIKKQK